MAGSLSTEIRVDGSLGQALGPASVESQKSPGAQVEPVRSREENHNICKRSGANLKVALHPGPGFPESFK